MNATLKLLIGAAATTLLALAVHGPLGGGQAFISSLQTKAAAAVASSGVGVRVSFPKAPLERLAVLTGPADPAARAKIEAAVRAVPGVHDVAWTAAAVAAAAATTPRPTPKPPAQASTAAPPRPAAQTATAALPVAAPSCGAKATGVVIRFALAQTHPGPQGRRRLAAAARAIKACPGLRIEIDGHADASGSASVNQTISLARSQAVLETLVRDGVDRSVLSVKAFGADKPAVAGDDAHARAQNRRVELLAAA